MVYVINTIAPYWCYFNYSQVALGLVGKSFVDGTPFSHFKSVNQNCPELSRTRSKLLLDKVKFSRLIISKID